MSYRVTNSLGGFDLFYEEYEENKVTKKVDKYITNNLVEKAKKTVIVILETVVNFYKNIIKLITTRQKKAKKPTKSGKNAIRQQRSRGILGIGALFVVVSITYSSYVIFSGVDSVASKVMLIPQVVFASYTLIKAFSKIYK